MKATALDIAAALRQPPPTPEQRAVIESDPSGPQLVVAGAGSGKTETMSARVVWLVANDHVQPEEVLGLTFTRKAATELSRRVDARLRALRAAGLWEPAADEDGTETLGSSATVSTYHAYAGRLVREHGLRLGVEPETRLLTEAAVWQYASDVVHSHGGDLSGMDRAASSVTASVLTLAGEVAEHLTSLEDVRRTMEEWLAVVDAIDEAAPRGLPRTGDLARFREDVRRRLLVLPVVEELAARKRARDAMDFSDQMALAARLALEVPEIGVMERARYRAVLLDEFQDTSEAQMLFLRALFTGPDGRPPVTAVGDPNQSIYGWRGASATTLARFPGVFRAGDATAPVRQLSTSWRNDGAILDAANVVAAPLRDRLPVPVDALAERPGAGPGSVLAARFTTHLDEADWLASHLAAWRASHPAGTAAVLCRKRSQFPAVVAALEAHDVPFEVLGLGGLLTMPEVADIVSLLQVVDDPTRGDHLMRLLTGPLVQLGAADLDGLWAWARHRQALRSRDLAADTAEDVTLSEALEDLPGRGWVGEHGETLGTVARERLAGLAAVVRRVRGLTGLGLAELVGEAERSLGLDIEVAARPEYTPAAARAHLDAFADVAAGFALASERPTLRAFLDWLTAALAEERGLDKGYVEPTAGAVQVMTVHSSKGLEWDTVVVPGLVEGTFPAHGTQPTFADGTWVVGRPKDSGWLGGLTTAGIPYALRGDHDGLPALHLHRGQSAEEARKATEQYRLDGGEHALAEERRLAYVAFTRARSELVLTAYVWGTQKSPRVTSRYLTELTDGGRAVPGEWAPMPQEPKPQRPDAAVAVAVQWPDDPMAGRRARLVEPARRVRDAVASPGGDAGGGRGPLDAEIDLLLAERDAALAGGEQTVALPRHLSTSALVALADDPEAYALALRRPVPAPPADQARRGTAFHAWVEQHYARAAIVDLEDLPGSADEDAAPDADLPALRARFLASGWAGLVPLEVETSVETVVADVALRGRVDAVFRAADVVGAPLAAPFTAEDADLVVVDWKTGRPPDGERATTRALQLATYALAYGRLRGLGPRRVRGAFYYAATGETVWPELAGAEALAALLP